MVLRLGPGGDSIAACEDCEDAYISLFPVEGAKEPQERVVKMKPGRPSMLGLISATQLFKSILKLKHVKAS